MSDREQRGRFLELLEANQDILHKICHVYGAQEADRQDLKQDMVCQLWKSYPDFRGDSKFSTWMYRVCLNTALVFVRRKHRTPRTARLETCHQLIAVSEQKAETGDDIECLYRAIQGLRRFDRALILLYLDRLPYKDIAGITGIAEGNVSVRLVRIKKKLRAILQKETHNGQR